MFYHLIKRGRTYYFRIRIPKDLLHYFSIPEVRKSLKTSNLPAAKILYSSLEEKYQKSFALLRSGFVSEEQVAGILSELRGRLVRRAERNDLRYICIQTWPCAKKHLNKDSKRMTNTNHHQMVSIWQNNQPTSLSDSDPNWATFS